MKVESMNIGLPRKELFHGKEFFTGICKRPVDRPLFLGKSGFEGDGVADGQHHGGSDKAVCVYSLEHYAFWETALGMKLLPAAFGENLTVSGLLEADIHLGDILKISAAVVQVSQPRQPCKTLAARYGRNDFVKQVVDSGRTGLYCKVLEQGAVETGDELMLLEKDARQVSVAFANHIYHHDRKNRAGIKQILAVPALSESWRNSLQELKEKA